MSTVNRQHFEFCVALNGTLHALSCVIPHPHLQKVSGITIRNRFFSANLV